jgi:hypothetical protein
MTEAFDQIGIAMHYTFADIHHSCDPNCIISYEPELRRGGDHAMKIWPLRNIDEGEAITISYVPNDMPTKLREKTLKDQLAITCDCSKCKGEVEQPVEGAETATAVQVNKLITASREDTTTQMALQRLRYALHLHLEDGQDLHDYPAPIILRNLVRHYAEIKEYSLAFCFGILLRKANKRALPTHTSIIHPQKISDRYILLRVMDKIIESEDWTDQEIDLAHQGLDLVGLRAYWLDKLWQDKGRMRGWSYPFGAEGWKMGVLHTDMMEMRRLKDNEEERREAKGRCVGLAEEVLGKVRGWSWTWV